MRKRDLEKFKKILVERKSVIVDIAESMREQGLGVEKEDLADEVDLASTETGQTLNLAAVVTGTTGSVTYEWFKDGNPIGNGGTISGADTASLSISPLILTDAGSYVLEINDSLKALAVTDPMSVSVFAPGSLPVAGGLGLGALALVLGVAALRRTKR